MDDKNPNTTMPEKREDHQKKDAKATKKKDLKAIFNEYKSEFKKIVWPTKEELARKTATVIAVSLMFGVVIFGMDSIYNIGVQLFVQLVTK